MSGSSDVHRRTLRGLAAVLLVGLLPLGGAAEASAQSWEGTLQGCAQGGSELLVPCRELGVAAQGLRAGVGLLSGFGHPVPGSVSTVGRRMGTVPRVAISFRAGGASIRLPSLRESPGSGASRRSITPSSQLSAAVGVFDGFRLLPTVGGVLSLDLLGSLGVVHLSSSQGLGGPAVRYGGGIRVGFLRESFTLPGVSLTAVRYGGTTVRYGEILPDGREVRVSPSTTALRFSAGKDLLGLGITAGTGWDRYTGTVETRVLPSGAPADPREWSGTPPSDDRVVVFVGGNLTYLVLQLTGEVGWAGGLGDGPTAHVGVDPSRGGLFGSAGIRLTY